MDFPRSNARPAEQAQVQVTVCPNWKSLNQSYLLRTATGGRRSFFECRKGSYGMDLLDYFHIKQDEIVWCLVKDLIGSNMVTSAFHLSNTDKKLKVRSSFNNYLFPPEIQNLIDYLKQNIDSYNDKSIAELVSTVIQPVGFLKSEWKFMMTPNGSIDSPYEANYGGIVQTYVRKPGDMLRVQNRATISVPTPALWNDPKFYKDRQHVPGKITLFVESETPEKNAERLESIFKMFFANESFKVDTLLKNINDAGHKSVQPLSDIPNTFLDLVSTIAIETLRRGIENRDFKLKNRFKYSHFVTAYKEIEKIMNNPPLSFEMLVFMVINEIKASSAEMGAKVVFALYYYFDMERFFPNLNTIRDMIADAFNSSVALRVPDYPGLFDLVTRLTTDNLKTRLYELPLISGKTLCDFDSNNGLSENEWLRKLSSEGDLALNWLDIFYYTETDRSPLKNKKVEVTTPDSVRLFGDTTPYSSAPAEATAISAIVMNDNPEFRQRESLNFTIIAHQIFNLTVPTETISASANALEAEGHLYRHHADPKLKALYQETCNRAHRFSYEICKTMMSELLPNEQRERYRVGFDPQTNQNYAMVTDSARNHVFDHKSLLGIAAEQMSKTFSEFTHSMCEWLFQESNKMVLSTVEPQVQGGRAVTYIK